MPAPAANDDPHDAPNANANADTALPPYAELHCLSDFSFLRGASSASELVKRAQALGYAALAITDECSLAGVVRALEASEACGLPLVVGSELALADGPRLVLLVETIAGYRHLAELITRGRRAAAKGGYRLLRADLEAVDTTGLLALWLPPADWRAPRVPAGAAPGARPPADPACAEALAWAAARFPGRLWIAVELHRGARDRQRLRALEALGAAHGLPLVASGDVHMHVRGRRALQDALTAVRLRRPLADCGGELFPNGERHLRPREVLAGLYPDALLRESAAIAARCGFSLRELRYDYPAELVPGGGTPDERLRALTLAGARARWPGGPPAHVEALLERELGLIAELGYAPFFLTVEDIVRWARGRGILCQGRGSAANSAVCFCLGITAVDPARSQLLFERFLSRERHEPPDIDVDFEHERREEVLQYVYARYGRERAALAATVITWQRPSAVRAIGRALGFGEDLLDAFSRVSGRGWSGVSMDARLAELGLDPATPGLRALVALAEQLIGRPRHLSQHVGGFVIADQPLWTLVPVENAAMPERTIIQWDKDDLETLGLLKVDCLALGMLSAMRRCLDLVAASGGPRLGLADIPAEDAATYAMLQQADSVGVFQVESRAQMAMLPRLKPARFYDLVIQVAIVRPGPIQGGMVHPYLRRRLGREPADCARPELEPVLGRTLGVPIFQEQVMHLAMVAAGFSAGEADQLRRAMAAWKRRGGLEAWRERLLAGMARNGYPAAFAERICEQIKGFGEYGFPESHAASFALLAYASSWLKCHHPAAFLAALLNAQPMGFYAPAQLVADARRHGVPVLGPDVTASGVEARLEPLRRRDGGEPVLAVRLGLGMVRGLARDAAARIEAVYAGAVEREAAGGDGARGEAPAPPDVATLARRARLDRRALQALAEAGALTRLSGHRHRAAWDVAAAAEAPVLAEATPRERRVPLPLPDLHAEVHADYASLGLSLRAHPLGLLRAQLRARRIRRASELPALRDGARVRAAGLVTCRQRPGTASGVTFVTLEDESGLLNVVVWRDLAERQRRVLLESTLLGVEGRLEQRDGVLHLVAERLGDLSAMLQGLPAGSRDFH